MKNSMKNFDRWMRNNFFDLLVVFSFIGQLCLFVYSVGNAKNDQGSVIFWISGITLVSLGKIILNYRDKKI